MKNLPDNNTVKLEGNTLFLKGPFVKATVMALWKEVKPLLKGQVQNIDLSEISQCDTASLAFLVAVLRETRDKASAVRFIHMPKQMFEIAKVNGLTTLLPMSD